MTASTFCHIRCLSLDKLKREKRRLLGRNLIEDLNFHMRLGWDYTRTQNAFTCCVD
jgi:hypothetical protein